MAIEKISQDIEISFALWYNVANKYKRRITTMTKTSRRFIALLLVVATVSVMLSGCDLIFGQKTDDTVNYDEKMDASTGKWLLLDEEDTYFIFDGSEGVMTFSYYEDGALKYQGSFRSIYKSSSDAKTPLTFILTRSDKEKEDWISCYAEGVDKGFTQFSIICAEEDLGFIDGTVYTHVYRIGEMPYKFGTYVLEGNSHKSYGKDIYNDGQYRLPEGTYTAEGGQSLFVLPLINRSYSLFIYTNGETVVEGIFNISEDRRTLYLYIENDIYEKVRKADMDNYDTTVSFYYPPDFYLRGSFDNNDNSIVINGLYHHTNSPTEIQDSVWVFDTYTRQ